MLEHLIHSSNPLCYTLSPYITRPYLNITNTVVQLDAYNAMDFTRCLIVMLILNMNIYMWLLYLMLIIYGHVWVVMLSCGAWGDSV